MIQELLISKGIQTHKGDIQSLSEQWEAIQSLKPADKDLPEGQADIALRMIAGGDHLRKND